MKHLREADAETIDRLSERLKNSRDLLEFQRIQCVLLRLTLGASAAQIAMLLGWATATVHALHSRWGREGDEAFVVHRKGGRRNQNMSAEDEAKLMAPFLLETRRTGDIQIDALQRAYERHVGRPVALSTVYRLLHRHGWRKAVSKHSLVGSMAEALSVSRPAVAAVPMPREQDK